MLVHVGARIFKGQRSSPNHKMLLFVSWRNQYAIIEWPLVDAPKSTHAGLNTSLSLSRCCCLHFCRNTFGLMLAQGYFKGQRPSFNHKSQLFMTLCDMQSSGGNYSIRHQIPMVYLLLLVYLNAVAYISIEINWCSFWRRDILRVEGQALITNCNFLWLSVTNMQPLSGNYSVCHRVPMVFLFLLVYLSAAACISEVYTLEKS